MGITTGGITLRGDLIALIGKGATWRGRILFVFWAVLAVSGFFVTLKKWGGLPLAVVVVGALLVAGVSLLAWWGEWRRHTLSRELHAQLQEDHAQFQARTASLEAGLHAQLQEQQAQFQARTASLEAGLHAQLQERQAQFQARIGSLEAELQSVQDGRVEWELQERQHLEATVLREFQERESRSRRKML